MFCDLSFVIYAKDEHFMQTDETDRRVLRQALADEVARIMEPVARPLPLYPQKPQVVLVVGVNGSGKTTTIGKLASQFRAAGKKVVIAAGDTFRAAAVEQLQVWGQRAGVPVLTAPEGSDPASLAFDALTRARAEGLASLPLPRRPPTFLCSVCGARCVDDCSSCARRDKIT